MRHRADRTWDVARAVGCRLGPAVLTLTVLAGAGCAAPREQPEPAAPAQAPESRSVPASTRYFVYHVRRGDTLSSLGRRFGVSWRVIAADNEIADPDDVQVGRVLLIPLVEGRAVPEPSVLDPVAASSAPAARVPVGAAKLHRGSPSSPLWWPTAGTLVRGYGDALRGLPEPGIAIAAPAGAEVCAVAAGEIVTCLEAGDVGEGAWGNTLSIAHAGGLVSWYAHLDSILVSAGDRVDKGQPIGTVGSTGEAASPQLAFRLFRNERPVDPLRSLP
jgi:murein DD-endopeptidase MepM/ murein hydrolase activator NlpD